MATGGGGMSWLTDALSFLLDGENWRGSFGLGRQAVDHLGLTTGIQHLERLSTAGKRACKEAHCAGVLVPFFECEQCRQALGR